MTAACDTGDLDLARYLLTLDEFIEGHVGTDADEFLGEKTPSSPGTTTLHLNGDVADQLLLARGWKIERTPMHIRTVAGRRLPIESVRYVSPDCPDRVYWGRDEALTVALTAEVV